ncbi:hypothetical protein AWB68_04958 [Caballeronia choica]|jgi:DNA-binding NarL/FixJ family response regulator|uniref:Two component LuxR family transcriptional regulator n=1 Tax=Caballeronia choica TaxID=326476 RepID=A0A158K592_9BURK|nr:hypothetical protein AWB68_04958 [Caballeronia choica]
MTAADISVLLVDDHAVVREGYRRLLELSPDVARQAKPLTPRRRTSAFARCDPTL